MVIKYPSYRPDQSALNFAAQRARSVRRFQQWQLGGILVLLTILGLFDWLDLPDHWLQWLGQPKAVEWVIQTTLIAFFAAIQLYLFHRTSHHLHLLEGLVHACAGCRKIRVDGKWESLECYLSENTQLRFSHGICPECLERLYPEVAESMRRSGELEEARVVSP